MVPTPAQQPAPLAQLLLPSIATGGFALASMAKTSRSGRLNLTQSFQLRPSSSCHSLLTPSRFHLTMMPFSGRSMLCGGLFWCGGGIPPGDVPPARLHAGSGVSLFNAVVPVGQTKPLLRVIVWLPEW
jgi:hypothetical protein